MSSIKEIMERILKAATFTATRSSAPGGQSVNTSNSRATMRFPHHTSPLPLQLQRAAHDYIITSHQERAFEANKRRCLEKAEEAVGKAWRREEAAMKGPSVEKRERVAVLRERYERAVRAEKMWRKAVNGDRQKPSLE